MFSRRKSRQGKRRPPRGQWDDDGPRFALPGLKPVRMGIGVNDNDTALDDDDDAAWDAFWREEGRAARPRKRKASGAKKSAGTKKTSEKSGRKSPAGKKPARKPASRSSSSRSPAKKKPARSRTKAASAHAATQGRAARGRAASSGRSSAAGRRGGGGRGGGRSGGNGRSFVGALAYYMAIAGIWVGILFGGALLYFAMTLPDTSGLYGVARPPSLQIVAENGDVLSHRGGLGGSYIALSDMPPYLPEAVIATEDQRFYWHFGIDPIGLVRALVINLRAGHVVQGGSTITQQLAKNIFLTPDRTISRKLQEMILSVWLEMRFTKEEILTMYLNRVYLGGGAYGVGAASERYFQKPVRALNLPEAAMLAGLLKAPSRYSPTNDIGLARERAAIVLHNMVGAGYITQEEARLAETNPARLQGYTTASSINYFVDWAAQSLSDYTGRPETDATVHTTIDPAMQRAADAAIAKVFATDAPGASVSQVAFVAMTPQGAVRAMVGGRNYALSQFNRAVQAERQPGSAFKPFVYLTAMQQGFVPDSEFTDKPVTYGGWSPSNYENRFDGRMTLRTALAKSVNTIAVQVAQQCGIRNVIATARRLGIQSDLPSNLSLALGSGSVNLLELTSAYASFANGGFGVIPHGIEEVDTDTGDRLYRRQGSGMGRVMDDRTLGSMNNMMQAVMIYGTGHRNAAIDGVPAGGKTGTSQDSRDAWFVGYTSNLVVGVWVGNDNGSPMKHVTGGTIPAKIWHDFMVRTQNISKAGPLPGTWAPPAAAPAPAQPEDKPHKWEEPGFFERLFGSSDEKEEPWFSQSANGGAQRESRLKSGHPGSWR
ncbi:PBP1A family penicillin-binding protein [Parvibaculum sp.]|uniref:transglycosylase domain-containing protein n=1 Tax=Parvibaculum sp. TaxID=2024848 RepID=UPI0025EB32CD|nr:PBP1A family penicillin-binding protein [Parvibaculum sp.]